MLPLEKIGFDKDIPQNATQILVEIDLSDDDAHLLERLTRDLCREIEELDVDAVVIPPAGPAPRGAKAGSGLKWGQLLITLAGSGSILTEVVTAVDGWLKSQGERSIKLEISGDRLELTGVCTEVQKAVIRHWIERHRG
jgi:hypothetical protein